MSLSATDYEVFEEDFDSDIFAMAPLSFLMLEMVCALRSRESQLRALAVAISAHDHGRRHGLAVAEPGSDRRTFDKFVDRLRAAGNPVEQETTIALMLLTFLDAIVHPARQLLMLLEVLARLEDNSGDGPEGMEEKFDTLCQKVCVELYSGEPQPQVARRPRF